MRQECARSAPVVRLGCARGAPGVRYLSGNSPFRCGRPTKLTPPQKNRAEARKAKKKRSTKHPPKAQKHPQKAQKHPQTTKKTHTPKSGAYARKKTALFQKAIMFLLVRPDDQQRREFPLYALLGLGGWAFFFGYWLTKQGCRVVVLSGCPVLAFFGNTTDWGKSSLAGDFVISEAFSEY